MTTKAKPRSKSLKPLKKIDYRQMGVLALVLLVPAIAVVAYINAATQPPAPGWIIARSAMNLLQGAGYSPASLVKHFDNPNTYISGQNTTPDWSSQATQTFSSYQAMTDAFAAGQIPNSVKAILYDDETWSLTPAAEQKDPAKYYQLAAALAHAHGKKLVATPAVDLVTALVPSGTNIPNRYTTYLSVGVARAAARYADVYEIQAQATETNLTQYKSFVAGAASQAKSVNPGVVVMAGLSTNPSGQSVTGRQLLAAVNATRSSVKGYWLNIPGGGAACPACGSPKPAVAIDFLNLLDSQSSTSTPAPTPKPTPSTTPTTPPTPIASATGALTGVAGKCLDNAGNASANGNKIQLWACNNWQSEQWTRHSATGPIVSATGYCLDAKGAGTISGTLVQLYRCNGSSAQQWTIDTASGTVINPHSGLCLDDKNSATSNGNQIWLYKCNNTTAQKWRSL